MADLFRGFAPISSKATMQDTLDRAVARMRDVTGSTELLVVTCHPSLAAGLTAPLGVVIETDPQVPLGNAWVTLPEPIETDGGR